MIQDLIMSLLIMKLTRIERKLSPKNHRLHAIVVDNKAITINIVHIHSNSLLNLKIKIKIILLTII